MKLLLEVKDDKAPFVLELLKNLKFVKTRELTPTKADVLASLKQSFEEVKLIEAGKLKGRRAEDLFDEL